MARPRYTIVRRHDLTHTTVGTSVDTAIAVSLRETSAVLTPAGSVVYSLPNDFTVVRLLVWWQITTIDTGAGFLTNPSASVVGARTAGAEEIEEMITDANFRAESGPIQDLQADWHTWVPCYTGDFDSNGTTDTTVGKGHADIRSARRIDSPREDFVLMLQHPVTATSTITQSVRASFVAVCRLP